MFKVKMFILDKLQNLLLIFGAYKTEEVENF